MRLLPTLRAAASAAFLLSSAAECQDQLKQPSTDARAPARNREEPFDLTRVAPNRATAVVNAEAGGVAEIAPDVVAAIEAGDLRRGATSVTDTITPLFQRNAQISGRLGVLVGDGDMLFGRVGYAEFDLGEAFPLSIPRAFSAGGVLVGAGAEMRLSHHLSLKAEAHSVDYTRELSDRQFLSGLTWHY